MRVWTRATLSRITCGWKKQEKLLSSIPKWKRLKLRLTMIKNKQVKILFYCLVEKYFEISVNFRRVITWRKSTQAASCSNESRAKRWAIPHFDARVGQERTETTESWSRHSIAWRATWKWRSRWDYWLWGVRTGKFMVRFSWSMLLGCYIVICFSLN